MLHNTKKIPRKCVTRRDKLLVRPWEQRRYENHRRKVQSALPAIDVGPPANRVHVFYKLKKQQKEYERCNKIEKDNLKLLQRMRSLMSTTRVDNTWATAQPNFLNRVSLYGATDVKGMYKKQDLPSPVYDNTRKGRCHACTPKKTVPPKIPEARVPWELPKPQVSCRRSLSLPPNRKVQIRTPPKDEITPQIQSPKPQEINSTMQQRKTDSIHKTYPVSSSAQSIVLTRGDLHLAVNFPPDTLVKLKEGSTERFLIPGPCQCKAIRS